MTRLICKTHYNSFHRALACQYVTSTVSRAFKGSEKCPGAARTLSHVPGPEGIYNVPFIGNALQFRSYSEYWTVFLFESTKLLGHRSTAVLLVCSNLFMKSISNFCVCYSLQQTEQYRYIIMQPISWLLEAFIFKNVQMQGWEMPEFTQITFQEKIKTHTCFFVNYTNNMVKCRGFALGQRTVSSCLTRNLSARSWRMKDLTQNVIRFHWWKLMQNARREPCLISSTHSIIICDIRRFLIDMKYFIN